jgi:hypothetical protein
MWSSATPVLPVNITGKKVLGPGARQAIPSLP